VQPGMPEGWKGIERLYGPNSKYAGRVYTRWSSLDGKHKHVCTPKQVITIDCQAKGLDPAAAIENYNRIQKEKEEAKRREREAKGKLAGEAREKAIQRFHESFGPLTGPLVYCFKGWTTRWHYQPNCDQVMIEYIDVDGGSWKLLKDLECALQIRIENGEEKAVREMIEDARPRMNPTEFARGSRTARETQGVFEISPGSGASKVLSQEARLEERRSRVTAEARALKRRRGGGRIFLDPEGPKQTAWAALEGPEATKQALAEFGALLMQRGFPKTTDLLLVSGVSSERRFRKRIGGVYYQMPEPFSGQRCYQKLLYFPEAPTLVGCDGIFIVWNSDTSVWEFATGLAKYRSVIAQSAACTDDAAGLPVWQARGPWMVQDGEGEFQEDAALHIAESTVAG